MNGYISFSIVLLVICAAIIDSAMPLWFPAYSKLSDLGNGQLLHFSYFDGISRRVSILLDNSNMMSSNLI